MPRIRADEVWATRCISTALGGVSVVPNDDGSEPGMYDMEIAYPDRPFAAVEVTAVADADPIELWKAINEGEPWLEPSLAGGWSLSLFPHARAKRLRTELPGLLGTLEAVGVREIHGGPWHNEPFEDIAFALGIAHLFQGGTDNPGSIYPTIERAQEKTGGFVPSTGDPLLEWLNDWIRQPEQAHNLEKLVRSRAEERHLFLILPGFSDTPFAVTDLLLRDDPPLPTVSPTLPPEVTHVWVMSTWSSGSGMRWSPDSGWQLFDKQLRGSG